MLSDGTILTDLDDHVKDQFRLFYDIPPRLASSGLVISKLNICDLKRVGELLCIWKAGVSV